jgi:hypothetical protein
MVPRCRTPRPVACRRHGGDANIPGTPSWACAWCGRPLPAGSQGGRRCCSAKCLRRRRYYDLGERGRPRTAMLAAYAQKKAGGYCVQTGCYNKATLASPRCDGCRAKLAARTRDAKRYTRACRALGANKAA